MPDWLSTVLTVLASTASSFAAVSTIVKPLKDKLQEARDEGAEEEQDKNEKKNQYGWTASQQGDIDELAVGNMTSISSLLIVVNTLIEEGPEKTKAEYREIRKVLLDYMKVRGSQNKSHKQGGK